MDADIETLDFGTLCYIVGQGFNDRIVARLKAEGYTGVKASFGYVVQHLLTEAKTITQLAACMDVTQQAASKRVQEMIDLGLLTIVAGADRRERRVMLSETGHDIVQCTRRLRAELAAEMLAQAPAGDAKAARAVLVGTIEWLGLGTSIRERKIQQPG